MHAMTETADPLKRVRERVRGAQRPRRTARVNLRADLVAEIQRLDAQLVRLRDVDRAQGAPLRVGQKSENVEVAEQIDRLQSQMQDSWMELTLEARDWDEWRRFKAAHPPREHDDYDQRTGVNFDEIVSDFARQCVVQVDGEDVTLDKQIWSDMLERLAPGDVRDVAGVAYALHEVSSEVPFSRAASVVMRGSAEDSGPPPDSE